MKSVIGVLEGDVVRLLEPLEGEPGTRVVVSIQVDPSHYRFPPTTLDQVAGCLKYDGPPKTLEQIEEETAAGFREHWNRKLGK